jgi:hypothetical protein
MNTLLLFQGLDFERMLDKYGLPMMFTFAIGYTLKIVLIKAYGMIADYIQTLKNQNSQCEEIRKQERAEFLESIKLNTESTNQLKTVIERKFGDK